jgi:hypothetical protein
MLALYCPRHGHEVLLGASRLIRLVNLGHGLILTEARCYDGELLTAITGAAARLPPDQIAQRPHPPDPLAHKLAGSRTTTSLCAGPRTCA